MKNKKRVLLGIITILLIYVLLFSFSIKKTLEQPEGLLINDVSRLNPTYVKEVIKNKEVQSLQETIKEARENNLKVSIAGKKHSMGGHVFYKDAVVLDMTSFNKVLAVNPEKKTIIVQSGATWKEVIEEANKHGLSVEVMQAYNSFSVGGSISVNVHESDPNYGPLIETVDNFRLMLANGTIVKVSREENKELFSLVVGGYGLLGVILEAELNLTENDIYKKEEHIINYEEYYNFFKEIRKNPEIEVIFARLSIAKDESLLREVIVTTYETTEKTSEDQLTLSPVKGTALKKFLFGLSRKYDWGKKLRWYLQKEYSDKFEAALISRNNLMNNDISFLNYYSSRNTDILQEYFIPVENLPQFIDDLREIVTKDEANLLSATIRYIPKNEESVLSYSGKESFGIVLYFNVGLSEKKQEKVEKWTQELIDKALENGGTYYLPYRLYASQEQIREAYPDVDKFFEKKREYDPEELFMNQFYEKYGKR